MKNLLIWKKWVIIESSYFKKKKKKQEQETATPWLPPLHDL